MVKRRRRGKWETASNWKRVGFPSLSDNALLLTSFVTGLVLDAPFVGGIGDKSLTIGTVLTNNITDGNTLTALNSADTVTMAAGLKNTGWIGIFSSDTARW